MGTTSARRVVRAFARRRIPGLIEMPAGLPAIALNRLIPESPRYLVLRGRGSAAGPAIMVPGRVFCVSEPV